MRFLKTCTGAGFTVAALALAACGGGGGSNDTAAPTPPVAGAPVAGTPGTPAAPTPTTPGTPAPNPGTPGTPAPSPNPATPGPAPVTPTPSPVNAGPPASGLPADFDTRAFVISSDGATLKAFSGVGKGATSQPTDNKIWAVDNTVIAPNSIKALRSAKLIGSTYFVLAANPNLFGIETALFTSADGQLWKDVPLPDNRPQELWSIAFSGSRYVMSGASASETQAAMMESTDGVVWRNILNPAFASKRWTSIAYGNGVFVAVNEAGEAAVSPDGLSWTVNQATQVNGKPDPADADSFAGFQRIIFDADRKLFLAAANQRVETNRSKTGSVYTSADGKLWTRSDIGAAVNVNQIYCDVARCIAATSVGTATLMESTNLVTWTQVAKDFAPAGSFISAITKTSNGWLAAGDKGFLLRSDNGSNWTAIPVR
jgi:hypothetical protein